MNILVFGDQTADQLAALQKICRIGNNGALSIFLNQVGVMLRDEIQQLPINLKRVIPDFLSVAQLVDAYHESRKRNPILESCLVTVAQLAHHIAFVDENPRTLADRQNSRIIGLCTGLIAASAVACSDTMSELIRISVIAVRIALRVGVCVSVTKNAVEPTSTSRESWSTIITGYSEEFALDSISRFSETEKLSKMNRLYLSAISSSSITISGPPLITKAFFQGKKYLTKSTYMSLPVYAPYHAPHLYSTNDIDRVLDDEIRESLREFEPVFQVHSANTGKTQDVLNAACLFEISLREILMEQVRWDLLLEDIITNATLHDNTKVNVFIFGESNLANSLTSGLKATKTCQIGVQDFSNFVTFCPERLDRIQNDKIAIIGMAGRFPGAANHEELWDLLAKGLDVHREVPLDRFDAQAHCDPSGKGKNKSHTPYGCFIEEPGLFDPRFFNMSPREAAQTDPMGRLALVTAYEALEMSGYVPNRTPSTKLHRIGTFYGQTSDDWREINAAENIDTYFITGGVRAFASGRINYYFKFSGPSFSIDTACSSSLAAIQLACTSLWAGDCDTACAGGLNVLTNPDIFSGLSKGQFLSKTGGCKTYDNDADGYCRGDGCGTVILKRYQDAIADKDNILGCILGAATNHSAEAVSITHPHAGAQEFLYKSVLANAGVDAHDVSYVEMHGTGTQAGDGIEMTSVTNVFAPRDRQRKANQTLHLGTIKPNIGHGEAASGINSLVKVMMMFQKNTIPANVGIKGEMNKSFPTDLLRRNVHIGTKMVPYPRKGADKRKIFLNNFSAAGGNTAILIEDGPLKKSPEALDPRSYHIITVTARSIASLKRNIKNLAQYVSESADSTLSSLSYTTTARRIQHNYRVAFSVSSFSQVATMLESQLKDSYIPIPLIPAKIAFAFTGQGSQYTSMGQDLYNTMPSFRSEIDRLDSLTRLHDFKSFKPLLDGADISALSPVVVQVGMICIQVALARTWQSWGIEPTVVIGHSLGEYAALHIAGVISVSDMILLCGRRAQLLEENCTAYTHGMLAVKGSVSSIQAALNNQMTEVACINGPEDTVLSGTTESIDVASTTLNSAGLKSTKLKLPFAFHSSQVESVVNSFEKIASSVKFGKPSIPILSPLTGTVVKTDGVINASYLARHARETVLFKAALESGVQDKILDDQVVWLEIGAHPICAPMIRSVLGPDVDIAISMRRGEDPWKTISNSLCTLYAAGVSVDFNEYHREFNDAHELLTLPTYSFDNKRYWLDYHNNWTLTKGETLSSKPETPEAANRTQSEFLTTSCQRIIQEQIDSQFGTIVIQSDLAEPKLHAVVSGHLVNDTALCPSSLYADMAMTAADYLFKKSRPDSATPGLNVCKMEVPKPLIARVPPPPEGQHIQLEAKANFSAKLVELSFRSVTPEGKMLQEHASGLVRYENTKDWFEDWQRTQFMVQTQIDILQQKLQSGMAHKVLRGMAYKLFKALVSYSAKYRGMEEVIIDGKQTEAMATVHFQTSADDGTFHCAPYWIDSLAHISGFIVNASDLLDSDNSVYISHGWNSIKISKKLSESETYRTYVRMQPAPGNLSIGDVYIFEGDEIIGLVTGLKFQNIPRRALNVMLPPPSKNMSRPVGAVTKPQLDTTTAGKPPSEQKTISSTQKSTKPLNIPKPVSNKQAVTVSARVVHIIAEETNVDASELVDQVAFENLGVDSLMSLTISAKFREELSLEISSTLFTDYPTMGEMKRFFSQYDDESSTLDSAESSEDSDAQSDPATPYDDDSISTPMSSSPSSVAGDFSATIPRKETTPFEKELPSIARVIIAEEMGLLASEITDEADLSELGMDSLMSLTILSSLREKTSVDLPSTFLTANTTIEEVENALGMRPKRRRLIAKSKSITTTSQKKVLELKAPTQELSKLPPATSVLLQGNPNAATKKLFLFPDGSGSATSYVSISNISPDVAVYGLNCPFMKCPTSFTNGIDGVSTIYLNEMKRRQPLGPYCIGGWSAGGVVAYEVAMQLISHGESVDSLILIDSPCPVRLEPLPARLHHFFDSIGLLGTGKPGGTPSWLLPHFEYSIKALKDYNPTPLPRDLAPPVFAIWAREGVCGKPGDPRPPPAEDEDPKPMKWLLDNRTDFGDNGWAQLIPRERFEFAVMGGNHFTMMRDENGETLGKLIKRGLRV